MLPLMCIVGATSIFGWSLVLAHRAAGPNATHRLVPSCNRNNRSPRTAGFLRFNVEDPAGWAEIAALGPDLVIHCGGVCDVDQCEASPRFAQRVNVQGVATMLDALPSQTRLVVCSSDHVFGGGDTPFDEDSPPCPISAYGRTRVAAERLVLDRRPDALVVRVGLPIGPSFDGRSGHLDWLRHRSRHDLPMTVIADEVRSVVWADTAAHRVLALANTSLSGIRHLAATHGCARPELAAYLCERFAIGARYDIGRRAEQSYPHLGAVVMSTIHRDALADPLPGVVPATPGRRGIVPIAWPTTTFFAEPHP